MAEPSPKKMRWQETVDRLKSEIDSTQSPELPAIHDLARKWDVSCDTVRKAVKHLVDAD
jgi:DNA-binding GntR family transcriptional regulator